MLDEIECRKRVEEDPCGSCNGTGGIGDKVCVDCLGQGLLLTRVEYYAILEAAGYSPDDFENDEILNLEVIG